MPHADLDALTDEIFEKTFNVNVTGTWQLTKMAMPHLLKSQDGNVVNITSVAGVRPMGSSIAYSMTKAMPFALRVVQLRNIFELQHYQLVLQIGNLKYHLLDLEIL